MMTGYKIVVAYDGTAYQGWQKQPNGVTVVEVLEKTFQEVFHHKIVIKGASRTDAGVHAYWQVASFVTSVEIAPFQLQFAWNNALPQDIVLRSIEKVDPGWNPHKGVVCKTYQYHFFTHRPLPFAARYGWYFKRPLDFDRLRQGLQVFVGTHDFRSFCTGYDMKSTIRTIHSISLEYDEFMQAHRIVVKGPGFLRYMIRRIVGACLYAASKDHLRCQDLIDALERKDPEQTLPNSPAKGLVLYKIEYDDSVRKLKDDDVKTV